MPGWGCFPAYRPIPPSRKIDMIPEIAVRGTPYDPRDQLIGRIHELTIALCEAEYDVANILAFDPEANIPPGSLSHHAENPRPYLLAGSAMGLAAWTALARACIPNAGPVDSPACLESFLADRTQNVEDFL